MTAVLVEITPPSGDGASQDIEIIPDIDVLLGNPAIAPGCGDDNPYQA